MSVAISWANKMQLAKCDIMVGFPISSHIFIMLRARLLATEAVHDGRSSGENNYRLYRLFPKPCPLYSRHFEWGQVIKFH